MVADATKAVYEVLEEVKDPEIPVISVVELGIVRDVRVTEERIDIEITPTYSGCPAMDVIPELIRVAVQEAFPQEVSVRNVLSPPWTTDWISDTGKEKLRAFGIAPPPRLSDKDRAVSCPQCGSLDTLQISEFGSTPCKAAWKCNACLEPFDRFKCH